MLIFIGSAFLPHMPYQDLDRIKESGKKHARSRSPPQVSHASNNLVSCRLLRILMTTLCTFSTCPGCKLYAIVSQFVFCLRAETNQFTILPPYEENLV